MNYLYDRLSHKLSLFFLCLLTACSGSPNQGTPEKSNRATVVRSNHYDRELFGLDAAIADGQALIVKRSDDNLMALEVVTLLLERARLSGNYDDYGAAEALLNTISARVAKTVPPCLPQAKLHVSLHRLQAAAVALDACPSTVDSAEIAGLRGDIAFYSGRYVEAGRLYAALVNQSGQSQDYVRLGRFKSKMGAPGEAAALLEAAEKRYLNNSATMRAWLKLQRASLALDRGRLDEALALFLIASDVLPGWWQTEDLIAELKRVRGDNQHSQTLAPDQIHQLRPPRLSNCKTKECQAEDEVLAKAENEARKKKLALAARTIDDNTFARFPEAAAGHLLTHLLKAGTNPVRALELAQINFTARPYGEAAIGLARALLANGRYAPALSILEKQQADGWDTAELYWVMRETLLKLEQPQRAAVVEAEALRRNPASAAMYGANFFAPP